MRLRTDSPTSDAGMALVVCCSCHWMKTQHVGTYAFQGDMPKIAELTGNL